MSRLFLAFTFAVWLIAPPAVAQTEEQELGQMRLYVQQLEERVRQLTGDNERLLYQLNQMRASLGQPQLQAGGLPAPGAIDTLPGSAGQPDVATAPQGPGASPQELSSTAAAPNDQLIPSPASEAGAPVDLSALAGGLAGELVGPAAGAPASAETAPGQQLAGMPAAPSATTALSGSARDEYDLAYGYILTGDYGLAEETFKTWLAAFPNDPQVPDAEFWLGESHLQQGEYRDAANAFLTVYKSAPDSPKGPDSLLKLGVSLSALGEKTAACGTFAELGRRYRQASQSLTNRVHDEESRAGC